MGNSSRDRRVWFCDGCGGRQSMRALRWVLAAAVIGSVFIPPGAASANGGAYLSFDRTHYLPGETAVASVYVSVPPAREGLLERGPFYAYLLPKDQWIREGRPVPPDAIRLGALTIEPEKARQFDLEVSFTVPELPGDFYNIGVCNDPCTLSGFRESISGYISLVGTAREAELLNQQGRLFGRVAHFRREAAKSGREAEDLQARLDSGVETQSDLAAQVERLEAEAGELQAELAAASLVARAEEATPRPLIATWAATGIAVGLLMLAAAVGFRRRRSGPPVAIPETPELVPDHS
jgi:MYXO-CTERM domain-containing protein